MLEDNFILESIEGLLSLLCPYNSYIFSTIDCETIEHWELLIKRKMKICYSSDFDFNEFCLPVPHPPRSSISPRLPAWATSAVRRKCRTCLRPDLNVNVGPGLGLLLHYWNKDLIFKYILSWHFFCASNLKLCTQIQMFSRNFIQLKTTKIKLHLAEYLTETVFKLWNKMTKSDFDFVSTLNNRSILTWWFFLFW